MSTAPVTVPPAGMLAWGDRSCLTEAGQFRGKCGFAIRDLGRGAARRAGASRAARSRWRACKFAVRARGRAFGGRSGAAWLCVMRAPARRGALPSARPGLRAYVLRHWKGARAAGCPGRCGGFAGAGRCTRAASVPIRQGARRPGRVRFGAERRPTHARRIGAKKRTRPLSGRALCSVLRSRCLSLRAESPRAHLFRQRRLLRQVWRTRNKKKGWSGNPRMRLEPASVGVDDRGPGGGHDDFSSLAGITAVPVAVQIRVHINDVGHAVQ